MKVELRASSYRVELDESDVSRFASRWPCYGERRPLAFVFSADNGDLTDIEGEHGDNDESGVAALSNDASTAGAELLALEHVAELRRPFSDPESVATMKRAELVRLAILAGRIVEATNNNAIESGHRPEFESVHSAAVALYTAAQCALAKACGFFVEGEPAYGAPPLAFLLWSGDATAAEMESLI